MIDRTLVMVAACAACSESYIAGSNAHTADCSRRWQLGDYYKMVGSLFAFADFESDFVGSASE